MKIAKWVLSPRDGLNLALIRHRCKDEVKWHEVICSSRVNFIL